MMAQKAEMAPVISESQPESVGPKPGAVTGEKGHGEQSTAAAAAAGDTPAGKEGASDLGAPQLKKKFQKQVWTPSQLQDQADMEMMGVSAGIVCAFLAGYLVGEKITSPFVTLSYWQQGNLYGTGVKDLFLYVMITLVLLFLRAFVLLHIGRPLARLAGIRAHRKQQRFSEQLWIFLYTTFMVVSGIVVIAHNRGLFGLQNFWTTLPLAGVPMDMKVYYLTQMGYWSSTLVALFLEERRKDFSLMLVHHLSTMALVLGSYYCGLFAIGMTIHINMDVVDILLPSAKMLKYSGFELASTVLFVSFVLTWIVTRHFAHSRLVYNVFFESVHYTSSTWDPSRGLFWSPLVRYVISAFLFIIEVLCVLWFMQIWRIVKNTLRGSAVDDTRSDSEAEDVPAAKVDSLAKKQKSE